MLLDSKDTHRPPLGHSPVAFAGRAGAIFDVWWFGHRVTWSGLIRAADIAAHLGFAATFSRTLDQGEAHRSFLLQTHFNTINTGVKQTDVSYLKGYWSTSYLTFHIWILIVTVACSHGCRLTQFKCYRCFCATWFERPAWQIKGKKRNECLLFC